LQNVVVFFPERVFGEKYYKNRNKKRGGLRGNLLRANEGYISLSFSLSLCVCVCVCVFISYQSSTSLFLSLSVCLCLCVCVYLFSIYLPSQSLFYYWIIQPRRLGSSPRHRRPRNQAYCSSVGSGHPFSCK
jgi:hypothetical protein